MNGSQLQRIIVLSFILFPLKPGVDPAGTKLAFSVLECCDHTGDHLSTNNSRPEPLVGTNWRQGGRGEKLAPTCCISNLIPPRIEASKNRVLIKEFAAD